MIARIIELSAKYRWFVLLVYVALIVGAGASMRRIQLDAIPDLSDPQVIVFTEWKGRSPTLVEDQVTEAERNRARRGHWRCPRGNSPSSLLVVLRGSRDCVGNI